MNKPITIPVTLIPDSPLRLLHNVVEVPGIFETVLVGTMEAEPAMTISSETLGSYKLPPTALAEGLRAAKAQEHGFFAELSALMHRHGASFEIETTFDIDEDDFEITGRAKLEIRLRDGYRHELADIGPDDSESVEAEYLYTIDDNHERWRKEKIAKELKRKEIESAY